MAKCLGTAREQPCQTSVYHCAFPQAQTSRQRLCLFFSPPSFPLKNVFLQVWKNAASEDKLKSRCSLRRCSSSARHHQCKNGCVHVTWCLEEDLLRDQFVISVDISLCRLKSDAMLNQTPPPRPQKKTLAGRDQSKWVPYETGTPNFTWLFFWGMLINRQVVPYLLGEVQVVFQWVYGSLNSEMINVRGQFEVGGEGGWPWVQNPILHMSVS